MLTYGAEQNHVEAMFWLGLLYYNSEHSEEASSTADYTQAYKWWSAAAELGCLHSACLALLIKPLLRLY